MFLLFLLLLCGIARADVFVVTDQNNAVVSLSEADDAVVQPGFNKTVLKGTIANLPVSGNVTMFDFKDGSFTLNQKKVTDRNAAQQAAIIDAQNTENLKASAIKKAIALGFTSDEIQAVFGK